MPGQGLQGAQHPGERPLGEGQLFQRASFQTAGGIQLPALQQNGFVTGGGLAFQTGLGGGDPAIQRRHIRLESTGTDHGVTILSLGLRDRFRVGARG